MRAESAREGVAPPTLSVAETKQPHAREKADREAGPPPNSNFPVIDLRKIRISDRQDFEGMGRPESGGAPNSHASDRYDYGFLQPRLFEQVRAAFMEWRRTQKGRRRPRRNMRAGAPLRKNPAGARFSKAADFRFGPWEACARRAQRWRKTKWSSVSWLCFTLPPSSRFSSRDGEAQGRCACWSRRRRAVKGSAEPCVPGWES